jgi:ribosomal protein S18 acetylase RimI-like enzyme
MYSLKTSISSRRKSMKSRAVPSRSSSKEEDWLFSNMADVPPEPMTKAQAEQIAHLLNENNELQTAYDGSKILNSKAKYYPEHYQGLVFGSIAVQRVNFMLSEIKHLVVHPAFRRGGLAREMLTEAEARVETPVIFATIRSKNTASLKLFHQAGFRAVIRAPVGDHETVLLIKANAALSRSNNKTGSKGNLKRRQRAPFGLDLGYAGRRSISGRVGISRTSG